MKTSTLILSVVILSVIGIFFLQKPTTQKINFPSESKGCSNIFVYKVNANKTQGISVSADKDKLKLTTKNQTFKVGNTEGLKVELLIGDQIARHYCNDAIDPEAKTINILTGYKGTAVIKISQDKFDTSVPFYDRNYKATVQLHDVHFRGQKGNEIIINNLNFDNVVVGWLPG